MDRSDAERTIVDVQRLRHSTRHALNPIWYPNIGFGLFFIGTAVVAFLEFGTTAALIYWALGGLLTIGLVIRHYARVEESLGVRSSILDASTLVVLALVAGVVAANVLAEGEASAPTYVGAAGTLALGVVLRDRVELAAGIAIALVATAVAVTSPAEPGAWANLGLGVSLFVAGLVGRERA